jgi:hypothetical protein
VSLAVPTMTNPDLASTVSFEDGIVRIVLTGSADSFEAKSDLETTMQRLHDEALRVATSKVVVDLRGLSFMNSSCFKVFVSWLASVRALDESKQYKIHLVSSPAVSWQKRSLNALSCFAVNLVVIEN